MLQWLQLVAVLDEKEDHHDIIDELISDKSTAGELLHDLRADPITILLLDQELKDG